MSQRRGLAKAPLEKIKNPAEPRARNGRFSVPLVVVEFFPQIGKIPNRWPSMKAINFRKPFHNSTCNESYNYERQSRDFIFLVLVWGKCACQQTLVIRIEMEGTKPLPALLPACQLLCQHPSQHPCRQCWGLRPCLGSVPGRRDRIFGDISMLT